MIINTSSYTSAIPVALSDTINIPGPVVRTTGATTSLTANKLVDTNANFVQTFDADNNLTNQGVQVGQVVYNMYAMIASDDLGPTVATVTAVDSNTQLTTNIRNYSLYALIGFTALATILYHNPMDKSQMNNFLKNLAIIGGLILLIE